jgi:hypothetical protein
VQEKFSMDTLEIEFQRLFRERDFDRAHVALEKWSASSGIGEAQTTFWRACLLDMKGDSASAILALSKLIASGNDDRSLCLVRRARMYLDQNELKKSLLDYQAILNDPAEHLVTGFHTCAKFRSAFILARLGDLGFEQAIEKVPPDYEEWVVERIRNVVDLRAIFKKTRSR